MSAHINRKIVLNKRPQGEIQDGDLVLKEEPVRELKDGEVLIKTLWLSLDPYMRGRMSDAKSYADPVPVGGVMTCGTVSEVIASELDGYKVGDLVMCFASGWQDYTLSDGSMVFRLDPNMAEPSLALGVLGMPGATACAGRGCSLVSRGTGSGPPRQRGTLGHSCRATAH